MSFAIGVDLGATKVGIGCVDSNGNITHKISLPTGNTKNAPAIINEIAETLRSLLKEAKTKPMGIGIGIAGQIDPKNGMVKDAPNLEWHEVPIVRQLSDALGLKVAITNDVRAATLGEWLFGAGKGCKDLVCVFIGTGIGGGVISGGKLLEGSSFTFGEIGHMSVDLNGPKCACGNIGCVEAFAGGASIGKRAKEAIEKDPKKGKTVCKIAGHEIQNITSKTVVQAYREKDPLACEILGTAIEALTAASINIVNILNPEKLIFSGGVVIGFPELLKPIEEGVRKRALPFATQNLKILQGTLKNDAGIIGSAALVMDLNA